jgi:KaiC/GvpD/RAD55 family RecA-like ATPase
LSERRARSQAGAKNLPEGDDAVDDSDQPVDAIQEDMQRLKDWLLGDEESSLEWLDGVGSGATAETVISSQTGLFMDSIPEEMRLQVEALKEENQSLKERLDKALKAMPEDQSYILRKEMELKDLEEHLREKEIRMEEMIGQGTEVGSLENRFQEEVREKEEDFRKRESEFNSRIEQLEKELQRMESESRIKEEKLRLAAMNGPAAEKELDEKYQELQRKEGFISEMETENKNLRAELTQKEEELKKISDLLRYKDSEFGQRDEDLLYRERKLEEERRRFEELKKEASGMEELEMKKRLEALKEDVQNKESELRNREKYLQAKENELRHREHGIIEDEIEAREEERALEYQQAKVKTGNRRLDDLLLGGIPFGSNTLIHGPPFTGKEVMVGQFIEEALKKGIPVIWVLTDKTPGDIRAEMQFILSGYEEYENLGLVKYVDSYSMSMGQTTEDPYTVFLDDPTDHTHISQTVEEIVKEFKEGGHQHYRLAFRSLSTLIAYSDPISAFRFLSPFCGKRKRDGAVSMYTMEKGMHGEQEIQMIGSVMDGMLDFKVDQLKTYFAVKGITDVQSRSYIKYTATKSSISIGSFSLDHIR